MFFFSSRRRHTRCLSDWSSDVCSSDLTREAGEIGTDLTRFPSAGHLASWAGLCPGNDESAGKRRSGRTRQGSPWLRTALVEAAQAAARTKDTYLATQYRRLSPRRRGHSAVASVAHTIPIL